MSRTCGDALIRLLGAYGVSTVFGIPSRRTHELYRGMPEAGLRHVTPRHDTGASLMADGYARSCGEPGVCLLSSGPAVTGAATGIAQAYADSVPMLVISSANDSPSLGQSWGRRHEIDDLCAVTRPITALSEIVLDPDELPGLVAQAFGIFRSQRPRPVHIAIPIDILEERVSDDWQPQAIGELPIPAAYEIEGAAELLSESGSTVIVAGGGAQLAAREVTALAERLNAGVIMSNAGKGVVSDRCPLSLGGGLASAEVRDYLTGADVVLAIGTCLSEADSFTRDLRIDGQIIRIDIDPAQFRDAFPSAIEVLGDAVTACRQILQALEGRNIRTAQNDVSRDLIGVRAKQALAFSETENQHITLLNALRNLLPDDAIIFGDSTPLVYTGSAAMKTYLPRCWFYPAGFATTGPALAGAIGARLACPERETIALCDSNSFLFSISELATAIEEKLAIPVIVWHDNPAMDYEDAQPGMADQAIVTKPTVPDYDCLAAAFGCPGFRARRLADFQQAMRVARAHPGPVIITVRENDEWLL